MTFPIYNSDQIFEISIDFLLIINAKKSHYAYVKDLDGFTFHKATNKNKKYFCKSFLQCFSSRKILAEHKEVCLRTNSAQSVRLEKGTTDFKKFFKQIPVEFKFLC